MRSLLSLFERSNQNGSEALGYTYASVDQPAQFANAAPGLIVDTFTDKPPWIVVDLSMSSIVVASWPGKLWEVQVLRRATEQPRIGAGYVRATAVHIERELPSASLFGANGHAIEEVFRHALHLTIENRTLLTERSNRAASEVFSTAWSRWLAEVEPTNPHRNQDHRDTLAVSAAGQRSPVGPAFTVLHSITTKRARELEGDAAFVIDEEEQAFTPAWASAFSALLHACMALGASDTILSDDERSVLLAGYSPIRASSSA